MKWFKHDSNANADAKLQKLIIRYGLEGYGLYWYCLELIVGNIEAHNMTFQLEHDAEILAHGTGLHRDHVQEIMTYMVDLKLFENSGGIITCMKLLKRLDTSMTSNPKFRDFINKSKENHDGVMMIPDSIMQEEKRTEEKRTEKNIKGKKTVKRFIKPTMIEVRRYCEEIGVDVNPAQFCDHYEANGWKVGKNPMKDWKATVRNWSRK